MAKIFRKVRESFLKQGKTKKYILYALGEIVLVVIGILLALGVNNLNIENNNKKQEIKILNQLLVEYETNLAQIDEKITMRNLIIHSVEQLIFYADNGLDMNTLDSVSFHFNRMKYDPTFDPANGVTNELLNSGKFYIIQNEKLKNQLTSWSGAVGELTEQEQLTATFIYEQYVPYLLENFDHRSTINQKMDEKMNQLFTKGETKKLNINREISQDAFTAILNDDAIQNYVIFIGRLHQSGNMVSVDLRNKILSILKNLKSEIKLKS